MKRYGTVKYRKSPLIPFEIESGAEKLPFGQAPSNMAQFGRLILTNDVMIEAQKMNTGKDGEFWMIDVLNALAQQGKSVIAQPIEGEWLTTGDPLRYLQTTFKFALKRDDLRDDLLAFIKKETS